MSDNFKQLGDLFERKVTKKAPAYRWQDLALRVINELGIPVFKRSSVFKACKNNPENFILQCLNDTKELCETGEKWKYFFKIVGSENSRRSISQSS